eukprot:6925297-Prymnesium_polylepis.1
MSKRRHDGQYDASFALHLRVDHKRKEAWLGDNDEEEPSSELNSIEKILDVRRRSDAPSSSARASFAAQEECEYLC